MNDDERYFNRLIWFHRRLYENLDRNVSDEEIIEMARKSYIANVIYGGRL